MLLMPHHSRSRCRVSPHHHVLLSYALVSDVIRTLRILNSKLQNMLSGRYKSKVGPARVPRGVREREREREKVLYPSPASPGFHGARGKGPPHPPWVNRTQNIRRETPITNREQGRISFLFSLSLLLTQGVERRCDDAVCKLSKWTGRIYISNARYK